MAAPSQHIDMRAQIRGRNHLQPRDLTKANITLANMLIMRPDIDYANVVLSLKGTHWRAVLIYFIDGFRFDNYTKEYATPEEAMRVLLEDTSKHVYLALKYRDVID